MGVHQLKQKLEPTILVIFGATGDLSYRFLMPALYHLSRENLLAKHFWVVGFARRPYTHAQFRGEIKKSFRKNLEFDTKAFNKFQKHLFYSQGNFDTPQDFKNLAALLHRFEKTATSRHKPELCANRLFYFATLQKFYPQISGQLKKYGLMIGCRDHERTIRVLVEKPFGSDLTSAQKLNQTLNKYFSEQQIYRIDHYLGKETVQNLLTTRFANSIFEPIWNRNFIDHVQISSLEKAGVEDRGAFYEEAGALRDVLQNHLMQLLALTAMEPPGELSTKAVRDERAKIIRAIRKQKKAELKQTVASGQYQGYRKEPDVSARSKVETFIALKLMIDNQRWSGVPFYLRTGKKLKEKVSEISIYFKPAAEYLFGDRQIRPNVLTFRIQPNEGIFLHLMAKQPGFGIQLHPVTMELGYHAAFPGELPEAYERLLLDFMQGDQRLFARTDEIEYSWKYVDVIERHIQKHKPIIYKLESFGPKEADDLITRDGREWRIS